LLAEPGEKSGGFKLIHLAAKREDGDGSAQEEG
jgi:hypothetical protein